MIKDIGNKSSSEILRKKAEELLKMKSEAKILELIAELAFQHEEKAKRADELVIANKELAFQKEEKTKRADELVIANKELAFQNDEKIKRAAEFIVAKEKIAFQEGIILSNNRAVELSRELEAHQNELQAHHAELQTINEELLAARSATEREAEKYLELYDFAPIGYLSLSNLGEINEINQLGAKMLGKERLLLYGSRFGFFVSNDTRPIFTQFLDKVFTGIVYKNSEQCLLTMVDITNDRFQQEKLKQS